MNKVKPARKLKVGDKIEYTGQCLAGLVNREAWYTVKAIYKKYIIGEWAGWGKALVILPYTKDITIGWKK